MTVQSAPAGYQYSNPELSSVNVYPNTPNNGNFVVYAEDAPNNVSYTFTIEVKSSPILGITATPQLYANQTGTATAGVVIQKTPYTSIDWRTDHGLRVEGGMTYTTGNMGENSTVNVSTTGWGGNLFATAYNSCGSTTVSSFLPIGPPYVDRATVNGQNASSVNYVPSSGATLAIYGSLNNAQWSIVNGNGTIYPSSISCNANTTSFLRVYGQGINDYGTGEGYIFYLLAQGYTGYRAAYPNPTKDKLTIEFEYPEIAQDLLKQVALVNEKNAVVKSFDTTEAKTKNYFTQSKAITLDVKDLPKGLYYLHVQIGEKVHKDRISIE